MQIDDFGRILKDQGVRCGAGVPCSVFKPLVNYMTTDPELDYVPAASEGEAVAIAAGMTAAGHAAFALMQNSGLGNAVNPVTSLLYIYTIPAMLFVSHRGEPGKPDEPQHLLMGQITHQLAELIGLRSEGLDPDTFQASLTAALADGVPAAWICRRGLLKGGPPAPPVELTVRSSAVTPQNLGTFSPQITREQALEILAPALNAALPAVISTTGKASRELYELDDQEHTRTNRFYMVGSMGCAAGFGLGIARAQPERQVVVLDGDGAVLMKMGSLATAGHLGAKNFHHVVLDNGAYDSTGGQPTTSAKVDFAAIAMACGFRVAETVADPREISGAFARQLDSDGPTLLRVVVRTGARKDLGRPKLAPRDGWLRFCGFLQGETP